MKLKKSFRYGLSNQEGPKLNMVFVNQNIITKKKFQKIIEEVVAYKKSVQSIVNTS